MIPAVSLMRLLFLLLAVLFMASSLSAKPFTTLHTFIYGTNGNNPNSELVLSGKTLYGTTAGFMGNWSGTIFSVNTDGKGFKILYTFPGRTDGVGPDARLILLGNTLYGTTSSGGISNNGTIFSINTNGTGFQTLHSFNGINGKNPEAGLIVSGSTLYGTTYGGGTSDVGTVFSVNTDGTDFQILHNFTGDTNGESPEAGLILSGNTLYGTTSSGPASFDGTVFSIKTDGTGFQTLHSFIYGVAGETPQAGLLLSGNILYGTTEIGGSGGNGTVFSVNTDGTSFQTLHAFSNSDGAGPDARLIISGNTLYGTTSLGYPGPLNFGSIFSVNIDGTDFQTLHVFTAGSDGSAPHAGLILSGYTLYGTASWNGGNNGMGTVFSLLLSYTVDVSASPTNGGNVSGGGTFEGGSSHTLRAIAKSGYEFVNWTESTNEVSSSPSYIFKINANRILIANFAPKVTLKVIASPLIGGAVSGGGIFAAGSSHFVTVKPRPGYSFVNWTEGTNAITSAAIYAFTLSTNRTLTANFTKNKVP